MGMSTHHSCTAHIYSAQQECTVALCPAAAGQVLVVSTHNKEMSEEVHSAKYLNSSVASMAVCAALNRAGGPELLDHSGMATMAVCPALDRAGMSWFWPRLQQRSPGVTCATSATSVKLNN